MRRLQILQILGPLQLILLRNTREARKKSMAAGPQATSTPAVTVSEVGPSEVGPSRGKGGHAVEGMRISSRGW